MNFFFRCIIFLELSFFFASLSYAQSDEQRCTFALPESQEKYRYFLDHQEAISRQVARQASFARTEDETFVIPVIVHIIHNGEEIGTRANISAAQVDSQLRVLNEDFSMVNPFSSRTVARFRDAAGDAGIRFVLAERDPNGNALAEKGIRRLRSPDGRRVWTTDEFDQRIKPSTVWDTRRYLNIWVVDSLRTPQNDFVLAGYSTFPDMAGVQGVPASPDLDRTDGIVVRHNRFGSFDKAPVPQLSEPQRRFHLGRTTTHEIGHYLGLLHPFEGSSCGFDGDYCPDTPLTTNTATKTCTNLEIISCANVIMVQNFMDYGIDSCMTLFTKDQVRRMRTVIQMSPRRQSLVRNANVVGNLGEQLGEQVRVYPNPTAQSIKIEASHLSLSRYRLVSLQGQLLEEKELNWAGSIDLSAYQSGLYLLQIETNKGTAIKKITLQR